MRSVSLSVLLGLAGCHDPAPAALRPSLAASPSPPAPRIAGRRHGRRRRRHIAARTLRRRRLAAGRPRRAVARCWRGRHNQTVRLAALVFTSIATVACGSSSSGDASPSEVPTNTSPNPPPSQGCGADGPPCIPPPSAGMFYCAINLPEAPTACHIGTECCFTTSPCGAPSPNPLWSCLPASAPECNSCSQVDCACTNYPSNEVTVSCCAQDAGASDGPSAADASDSETRDSGSGSRSD